MLDAGGEFRHDSAAADVTRAFAPFISCDSLSRCTALRGGASPYELDALFDMRRFRPRQQTMQHNETDACFVRRLATVFVPQGKLPHFENLIADYVGRRTDRAGKPRDNQTLIDAIHAMRVATFDSLWTDTVDALPADVLIHEAAYTEEILEKMGPGPQHSQLSSAQLSSAQLSSARMVAQFTNDTKIRNLMLTHFSPQYQGQDGGLSLSDIESEAREVYDGNLFLAKDFDRYALDKQGILSRSMQALPARA